MSGISMPSVTIKILIIDSSLDDADSYTSELRNGGMAVHAERVEKEAELIEALEDDELEIILCSDQSEDLDLTRALELAQKNRPELPFLIIQQGEDAEKLKAAMRSGARDVIAKDDPEHLQLVVAREYADLCTRKELEQLKLELKHAEERCTGLIESSQNAIAYAYEGMHIHANPSYLNLFGYADLEDIEGLPIMDMVTPDHHAKFKEFLRSLNPTSEPTEIEVHCQSSDGNTFAATMEFSAANIDGEPCTQIIIRNQTPNKDLEKRIQMLSLQDPQTGLSNRQFFMQQLDEAMEGGRWVLLYIIIDAFNEIRSTMGIATSDAIIKEIAARVEDTVPKDEVLARFSDHSFTLLRRHDSGDEDEIELLASSICSVISEYVYDGADDLINPTCSIGIAYSDGEESSQDFLNHAYFACESARNEGGDRSKTYDADSTAAEAEAATEETGKSEKKGTETNISELLQHALENDRLRLVYQPVVSLQGDTRENYAVLSRLLDKNDEEILPSYFLSEAEESGQMAAVDHWVVKHAIKELAQQREEGRKVNFFITLSGAGIADESMLLEICDCLRDHKAKGAWLTFQLSDADVRAHLQEAKKLIEGLRKIKCQIAITQFGLTPKGETLLKHIPLDFVKLHPSFMENLATSQEQQDLLTKTNEMIHSHDIKTIATGVEDANSLAILWTAGVNYIQGYFLQEPSESISYDFNNPT